MLRYQRFRSKIYVFTLDALPLKPFRFCNTGINHKDWLGLSDHVFFISL